MENSNIIEQQQLDNNIEFKLTDRSRLTAGDRWMVEVFCEASMPIDESNWDKVSGDDPALIKEIREVLGEQLVFSTIRQRNFIDEKERDAIIHEMVEQIHNHILEYVKKPHFPDAPSKPPPQEARQKVIIRRAME